MTTTNILGGNFSYQLSVKYALNHTASPAAWFLSESDYLALSRSYWLRNREIQMALFNSTQGL